MLVSQVSRESNRTVSRGLPDSGPRLGGRGRIFVGKGKLGAEAGSPDGAGRGHAQTPSPVIDGRRTSSVKRKTIRFSIPPFALFSIHPISCRAEMDNPRPKQKP